MTRASDWIWFEQTFVMNVHDEQLSEHGGLQGIRDVGMLESALYRPQQLASYGAPDAQDLAAAYAFGMARNHPFLDGNKRTAFVLAETFLRLHGIDLTANDEQCYIAMLKLAEGSSTQEQFADWLRANTAAIA